MSDQLLTELHRAVCLGEDCLTARAARTEHRVASLEAYVYETPSSPPHPKRKAAAAAGAGAGIATALGATIVGVLKALGYL